MNSAWGDSDRALRVDLTRRAKDDLKKLPTRDAKRVRSALEVLAKSRRGDFKRLRGKRPSLCRLRVGQWRVMIEPSDEAIRVVRVLHRGDAYRKSSGIRQALPGIADGHDDWASEDPDKQEELTEGSSRR